MDKMGLGNNIKEFEKVFEDMDVKTGEIDAALDGIDGAVDSEAVKALLTEMQDGVGLDAQG